MNNLSLAQKQQLLSSAKACGEWMLANQVNGSRFDANRGRGLQIYNKQSGKHSLTSGWRTGIMCMAMLALYRRTGDHRYLVGAEAAGHYIMSLQIMDQRTPQFTGAFREHTPQSDEFCPRDSTTAAWALIWLYNETNNEEYLYRADLFGQWQLRSGMVDGWPLYIVFTNKAAKNITRKGSFQSGTGLFFYDLFMATGAPQYITEGLRPIAEKYRDEFIQPNGHVFQELDRFSCKPMNTRNSKQMEVDMHVYNDDFGNAMLQAASDIFDDDSFREAAYRNTSWLAKQLTENNGFPADCPSGIPVALQYFHDLGLFYNDDNLLKARGLALNKLLAMQYHNTKDSRLDGAFLGAYEEMPPKGPNVNMRSSAYAVMSLLKIETELPDIWLGRFNKRFKDVIPDPIDDVLHW